MMAPTKHKTESYDDFVRRLMPARVDIRCNATGEIRQCESVATAESDDFIWSEGNWSCDCNRHLFFEESKGNKESAPECSAGRYSVRVYRPDGTVLYDEFV